MEWFLAEETESEDEPRDIPLLRAWYQWRSASAWTHLRLGALCRGGGKQGRLPWQSTRTIRGLKIVSQIAVDGQPLGELVANEVCAKAQGVALMLLAGWNELKGLEAEGPLLVLFPGHCSTVLKKMGASPARINEIEIVVEEPNEHALLRRNATAWTPSASAEYSLELDARWASDLVIQAAEADWKALLKDLAGRMCVSAISEDQFYGLRKSQQFPVVYGAKMRLQPETGEKLLCSSGLEALFVRPIDPSREPQSSNYTIIWGSKHAMASAQTLSDMLLAAATVAGHRGVARSLLGIGLRVMWKDVRLARQLLRVDDAALVEETIGLTDKLYFSVDGLPAAASPPEITKFFGEVGWPIIPQKQNA